MSSYAVVTRTNPPNAVRYGLSGSIRGMCSPRITPSCACYLPPPPPLFLSRAHAYMYLSCGAYGTWHCTYRVHTCVRMACMTRLRERTARLAFAYITDNCTAGEEEREKERGEGPVACTCAWHTWTGECTYVCVCKKEKETSVIFMRAYDARRRRRSRVTS